MRKRVLQILLFIVFLILPFTTIMMINRIALSDGLGRMSSGSFGSAYSLISFDNTLRNQDILKQASEGLRIAITSDYEHVSGVTIRSIFFNKKYANFPMKEGRFFKPSDFTTGNNVAVIGKNIADQQFLRNRKTYIRIDDCEYRVLGILGYEKSTIFDNFIFVNALYQADHTSNNLFLFDCFESNINQAIDTFVTRLEQSGLFPRILSSGKTILDNLVTEKMYSSYFIMIIVCDVLCILLLIQEWNERQVRDFCILRLLGADTINITKAFAVQYCSILLPTIPINIIACLFLFPSFAIYLLGGYCSLVVILILCSKYAIYKITNHSIPEVIK